MLRLEDLHVAYGAVRALHGVSLEVSAGEIVTLVGSNGAGKSTTLRAISGLVTPSSGRVLLDGKPIHGLAADRIVGLGVAHAPEGRRIFTRLSVRENLEMGAFLRRDAAESRATLARVYRLFPRLEERESQPGGTLSGGEQQMLAIGRALMSRPRLLLLDEPSMGLAPLMVQKIFETIRAIAAEGATLLLVEQNAKLALETCHRGYVMESGLITAVDSASRLLADPRVRQAYLGE